MKKLLNLLISFAIICAIYIILSTKFPLPKLHLLVFNIPFWLSPEAIFHPSQDIIDIATKATMTDKARRIFYATNPTIDTDKNIFNQHCKGAIAQNTVELGCYTSDNHIYILFITNPKLRSEMITVAAHEMLHAAHAQLLPWEIQTLDIALEEQLPSITNKDLVHILSKYHLLEPGERDNELHSIMGSEYPTLAATLENHYAIYFSNRIRLVSFSQEFNNTFSSLEITLASLKKQIKTLRLQMKQHATHGRIKKYNVLVTKLNTIIKQYNNYVKEYNDLSRSLKGEEQQLSLE